MYILFFDESKNNTEKPLYVLGSYIIPQDRSESIDSQVAELQETYFGNSDYNVKTEFHAKEIFHGKGNCKGIDLRTRLSMFEDLLTVIRDNGCSILVEKIDVEAHTRNYSYPMEPKELAIKLILEDFQSFLIKNNSSGWAWGDDDGKESENAAVNYSRYKSRGTPFINKSINRINQISFSKSYCSRHIQLADLISFFNFRFHNSKIQEMDYTEKKFFEIWSNFLKNISQTVRIWAPKSKEHGLLIG